MDVHYVWMSIMYRRPLCVDVLYGCLRAKKKNSKVKHMGYRPTNSNSYTIDSLYRVCIADKESMVIGYHDHL